MKILFLDVDGCLNSKQHILAMGDFKNPGAATLSDADLFTMKRETNANNMWVLGFILDQLPDLKIVISSAWRLHYEIEQFKELFKIYKLDGSRIIDKTPRVFSNDRRHEIHLWLEDQHEKIDWVAVDDHPIFNLGELDKEREFLTDSWVGLSMHDAFKIIKHFKPEFKEPEMYI